jgi:hypothetical protein
MTKVDKNSVEKIANHVASAVNKNNVTPVGFWNRELGKIGGVSITPKRVAIGTGAVLGTATVLYIGYKWYKKHQILITVPPGSEKPSVEETNAINEISTIRKKILEKEFEARRGVLYKWQGYKNYLETEKTVGENNIDSWSTKATWMFDTVSGKTRKKRLTPAIAKAAVESAEEEYMKRNFVNRYNKNWWENILTIYAKVADEAEKGKITLPQNLININKKFASTKVMATRLATLRKVGQQWDNEGIRQRLNDRKLKINEEVVLNTIMATLEKRVNDYSMLLSIYDIKKEFIPNELAISSF